MTKIKFRERPIWRESESSFMHKTICVALEPNAILFRRFRSKSVYRLPIAEGFFRAAALEAAALKAEKQNARKARKAVK